MSKANETYNSVWEAVADTDQEAENLRVRAELMDQLATMIKSKRWTQVEAAHRCGVTQPRINDLLRGRMSRFSLDALVNVAAALGHRVHVELAAEARVRPPGGKKTVPSVAALHRQLPRSHDTTAGRSATSRTRSTATPARRVSR